MEEILKTDKTETVKEVQETPVAVEKPKEDERIKFSVHHVVEIAFYVIGSILLIMCFVKYGEDLNTYRGEFRFSEESYVGGDAYNYIISAARSTAVMVKSLILAVLGCSSIISGLLVRIASKK